MSNDIFDTKSKEMTFGKYTLDEKGNPIPATDLIEWAKWFESCGEQRQVAVTRDVNGYYVSTVFLGIDHNFFSSPPILWETMIFDDKGEQCFQVRYYTKEEALEGHEKAIEMAKTGCF